MICSEIYQAFNDNPVAWENFDEWYTGTTELKAEDSSYEEDYRKLKHYGIFDLGKGSYWFASRRVFERTDSVNFGLRFYHSETPNGVSVISIYSIDNAGVGKSNNPQNAVRPVVINPKNIEYVN